MGFTKFTQSEKVEAARKEEQKKISSFVKEAGKDSLNDLSDSEKEELQKRLTTLR